MANNLPTIAQLQDPAWLQSQSGRVQRAVQVATEGRHRAKNDVVKLNSNYVQKRAADKRWREAHPDAYLQEQQQPPATTTTSNPTPGQSTGGGQGQNVRFNQKIDKMDRRAQGQQGTTATSDRRDATADARDAGAPAPRPSTSVIGTTSSMGAANTRNPFQTPTAPAWVKTPAAPAWVNDNTNRNNNAQPSAPRVNNLPNGVPSWALPAAPRIPSGIPPATIPSGIPSRNIPANIPAPASYTPARPAPARTPAIPAGVTPGGNWGPTNGAYTVYFDPSGKRYMVTADGRFIPSVVNQRTLTGQPNAFGEAYDQAALARLAYARAMSSYLQPLPAGQQQSGGGFGSYYGGGFGGGGGGGGYTSYDPYNGNPAWYNNTDLTAWNIS